MLKILIISTWFVVWLVNCTRFNWAIVGFFILTKLLVYSFYLEDNSPSLVFVIQKYPNFLMIFTGETPVFFGRYTRIILLLLFTMKFFCIFFSESIFPKDCIFCVLGEENQEAFSENYSLISGVLQGLVKICRKYMEVSLFLLLSCNTLIL